jgi:hypothetical protein
MTGIEDACVLRAAGCASSTARKGGWCARSTASTWMSPPGKR